MKHTLKVTIILVSLFLLAQIVGLATVNKYIEVKIVEGKPVIEHADTIIGKQPEIKEKSYTAIPIIIAILIGTALIFLLIRFKLGKFWKIWFFLSVWLTLAISFDVYIARIVAVILAFMLAFIKTFKPNMIVHNFTEIFIYTGIAIIILPFLDIISGFMLLFLISIYDMIAVWKSKHMIKLAKFQTRSKVFAGLLLQYKTKKKKTANAKTVKVKARSAILGGGDIAFPLIFSAVVMENLILKGVTKTNAFLETSIITLFLCISLTILFLKGKKDTFYPAMPFLSIGCLIGYVIIVLINLI